MDREIYRAVPFRFAVDKSSADICKLEQLTNLFPQMKEIIELELFKFNNLIQLVNRLSNIYSASSAMDMRDDTMHIFLGPYHLSLGPAMYGAMRFKNISKALLASSQSKSSNENSTHFQKRRHDATLRRFRRAVRKLIHIKSVIDKLRLASILTPYNQYELYTRGIYDLVLAGHKHSSDAAFINEDFLEQINDLRSTNGIDRQNPLVASQYIKINTLLQLLSPSPHQTENIPSGGNIPPLESDDAKTFPTNENPSQSLLTSAGLCCSHHSQNARHMMFPINRSISQFYTPESHSKRHSRLDLRRNSSLIPHPVVRNSLPNLNSPTSQSDGKSPTLVPVQSHIPKSQEDALVNRISSLLTNYFQSHPIDTLKDSSDSLLSANETHEFDQILQRIKTTVDQNLSPKITNHLPSISTNPESARVKSSIHKPQLHISFRSQSFDDAQSEFFPSIPELNDNSIEF